MHILNEKQEELLKKERKYLNDLRVALVEFGAEQEDYQTLGHSIQMLDELFLLVVVGEFNAGKSAFINALLGQRLLTEGVTPTTTQINILKYGEIQQKQLSNDNLHVLVLPADLLREISIVDTPGTNAIIRTHEEITSQFVPRSDLVLFITSADRPFTESERLFLERIRNWGKKVVLVINKIDILQTEEEIQQVSRFVSEHAHHLLDVIPEVFPVSARLALRAKQGEPRAWSESRFEPLEGFIETTLDDRGRIRLKFLNPLGVANHLIEKYQSVSVAQLDLLKNDFGLLEDVESQLALYKEDMQREFNFRMSDVENILYEMEQRGDEFFEETFRLARIFDLLSKDRIQSAFEHRVVADAPQRIERKVSELIDWLVESDLRQWEAVNNHLSERRREHADRIVGEIGASSFQYDRQRVLDAVGREAQRVVEGYDKNLEAQTIAENAQAAVAVSAAVEVGALGLGALITALATTAAADVTGIVFASFVAALGLFVIPTRKRMAKQEMQAKVAELRTKLVQSLRTQFEREIERSLDHINEAIAPYTRFVRSERQKMQATQATLETFDKELERLKAQVEEL